LLAAAEVEEEETEEENEDDEPLLTPALPEDLAHVPYDFERLPVSEMAKRANNFYQLMNVRRSVRYFSSDPVPIEIIRDLVRTAGKLPTNFYEAFFFVPSIFFMIFFNLPCDCRHSS